MRTTFRSTHGRDYVGMFTAYATVPADGLTADAEAVAVLDVDGPDGEALVLLEVVLDIDEPVAFGELREMLLDELPVVDAAWEITDDAGELVFEFIPLGV